MSELEATAGGGWTKEKQAEWDALYDRGRPIGPLTVFAAIPPAAEASELGEKARTDWKSSEFDQPAVNTQAWDVQTVPRTLSLPEDDATRQLYPMADGCLDYFPNALAEVSKISYEGNLKHNPGEPMHWNRGKSLDHRNKIIRHTVESKPTTEQAIYHAAQAAWRALAELQQKIEDVRGVPMAPGARAPSTRDAYLADGGRP